MAGLFQQIDTEPFIICKSLQTFRFGLYVLESRERHALPSSKASFTLTKVIWTFVGDHSRGKYLIPFRTQPSSPRRR